MQINTPVLLVVFNRPELTEIVLNKLRDYNVKNIYVAIDGPRTGNKYDQINCEKVLSQIKAINWVDNLKILQQPTNLGCGKAVSHAISWFFSNNERGIILEDDCLPSYSFFSFCEKALNDFEFDTNIWHIDGSNFNPNSRSNQSLYEYSKFPLIWGWATWRDRWLKYQYVFNHDLATSIIKNRFTDIFQRKYWLNRLKDFFKNSVDTWDYQWMLTIWNNNGIVARPPMNLIQNIGFNQSGTHTNDKRLRHLSIKNFEFNIYQYTIDKTIQINDNIDNIQFLNRFMKGSYVFKYLFYLNDNLLKK